MHAPAVALPPRNAYPTPIISQARRPWRARRPEPREERVAYGLRLLPAGARGRRAPGAPAARPVPHERLARAALRRRAARAPGRLDVPRLGARRGAARVA